MPPMVGRTDLVVIGGGFWGAATALVAQRRGLKVVVVDDENPHGASRNAAGIVCKHWYKQNTITKMLPEDWSWEEIEAGIDFLKEFGLEQTGEVFTSYQNPKKRAREDCYLLPSCQALTAQIQHETGKVVTVLPSNTGVVTTLENGRSLSSVQAVVAAGACTDFLLARSGLPPVGVRPLRGRALISRAVKPLNRPITHMSRPYTHFTLRPWSTDSVRLGDSVEKNVNGGDGPLEGLRKLMQVMSPGAVETTVLDGLRPVCEKFTVKLVAPRVVAATGGHRVGLALAGLVANRCLKLLGK